MTDLTHRLDGKRACITGAAGVTGVAIAKQMLNLGACVYMLDLDEGNLNRQAEGLSGLAGTLTCDISDADAVQEAAGEMLDGGAIDILVNNAGILSNKKAAETSTEEWQRVMGANIDGAFYLTRALLPAMKDIGWGRIVNMCSLAMKTGGLTAGTAYTTSKGAMGALTFSLAREAAGFGVTANGIAPAYIKTPMVMEQLTEDQRQSLLRDIPVGRFCEADEVAHLVCYLASPLAGFITGEIIDINGGLHLD